jgi:hypothetical protein
MVSAIRKIVQAPVSTGVNAYGEIDVAGNMSVTALNAGAMQNGFGVEILNDIASPAEAIAWTSDRLTIHIQAGTSTIALILAAGGGVTGTPWAALAAIAAGGTKPGAMALTAMRFLPNAVLGSAPSSLDINLPFDGGRGFPVNPVLMLKHLFGGVVSVSFAGSNNGFVPSIAYGEKNKLSITALNGGKVYNEYSVVMQNTVAAGSETLVWTKNLLTISKAATSTVAQVIAGTVTGTPWGTVGKSAAAALTDVSAGTLVSTAISGLENFVSGDDAGTVLADDITLQSEGEKNVSLDGRVPNTIRISALSAGDPAEIELNVVSANA